MSRRAKESDASLAFSTTTIDDVMMMSFFGYFLPVVCFGSFFVCFGGSLFVFVFEIVQVVLLLRFLRVFKFVAFLLVLEWIWAFLEDGGPHRATS